MWGQLTKVSRAFQPIIFNAFLQNASRSFSVFSNSSLISAQRSVAQPQLNILQPASILINIQRGMKQVGRVRRRCKDCYFVMRQERLYVMCKSHPRHKQMNMAKKPKNTWILTDATQSMTRAW